MSNGVKIKVEQKHLDEAMGACKRWREEGGQYSQHCLIAMAAKDAGVDVECVGHHLLVAKSGARYVLPSKATDAIRAFDRYEARFNGGYDSTLEPPPNPPIDFEFEMPLLRE